MRNLEKKKVFSVIVAKDYEFDTGEVGRAWNLRDYCVTGMGLGTSPCPGFGTGMRKT